MDKSLGQYNFIERIGSGGIGTVSKTYDSTAARFVAIKILRSYFATESRLIEDFAREFTAISQLQHPSILAIYDFGREANTFWIAMEYIERGSIKERLCQPVSIGATIAIISELAEALDYAHERGIIHGDIKPSNVFISLDGRVLLSDFGMAILGERAHPLVKTALSTPLPAYMSPEQAQRLPYNKKSDIYSLGVLAYHLLTNRVPFDAHSPETVYAKQLSSTTSMPSAFRPSIPRSVDEEIARALSRLPENRHETCIEFARSLAAAAIKAGVSTQPSVDLEELLASPAEGTTVGTERPSVESRVTNLVGDVTTTNWLICPVCRASSPAGRNYCAFCWAGLRSVVPISTEEKTIVSEKRSRRLRRRNMVRAGFLAIVGLVLAGSISYAVLTITSGPQPLPPAVSKINSVSAPNAWSMYLRDSSHTSFSQQSFLPAKGTIKWEFATQAPIRSSPIAVGDKVYLATGDSRVLSLNAEDGTINWEYKATGPVDSVPAVADGRLYVGFRDGRFLSLDASSGKLYWDFRTENPVYSSPVVVDGVLYIGSADGYLYSIDAITGELRWKYPTQGWIMGSPAISGDIVCITSRDGNIYFIDTKTGALLLVYETAQPVEASPTMLGTTAYFGGDDRNVRAVSATARKGPFWSLIRWGWLQFHVWGLAPALPPQPGFIWAYRTGGVIQSAPALAGDTLYFGCSDRKLYAIDRITGEKKWDFRTKGPISASPAVAGNTVYFGSEDGTIYAVDAETGKELWQFEVGSGIKTSPAIANDTLYIGTDNGKLHAIKLSTESPK